MTDRTQYWCSGCGEPCWARMSRTISNHTEGVTGHAFVRTFAPDPAPLDVERLARALQTPNVSAWVRLLTGNVWRDGERLAPGFAGDMAAGIAAEYAALEEPTE